MSPSQTEGAANMRRWREANTGPYGERKMCSWVIDRQVVEALRSFCQREDKVQQRVVERALINYLADNDPDFDAEGLL